MKIVVCIKQISQVYARTGKNPESHYLNREDRIFCINPYDQSALELACRIKNDNRQSKIEINLLTIGDLIAEKELRRCLATGADHLYRIDTGTAGQDPGPAVKARLLARAALELGADLILCGKESLDRQNGQVGAYLARHLGQAFVSAAVGITLADSGQSLEVVCKGGKGTREIWECPVPAVISVDVLNSETGQTTLGSQYLADQYQIRTLYYQDISEEQQPKVKRVFAPLPRTKSVSAPDSKEDAFDRIEQLLTGSRIDKTSRMLEGDVVRQADEIVLFLQENGYIPSLDPSKDGA
jgi:electron transfer flavoprotein beta subunit